MDEYLKDARSDRTVVKHGERSQIGMSSDKSELTRQNSRDLGLGVDESISGEWTNEKHSLYLKSMEASFVRQLHNNEYHSEDMLGWHSEDNPLNPNMSLQSDTTNHTRSTQFKVQQIGCWKKIKFGRAQSKFDNGDESRILLDNQWIRRFRSAGKCQEVVLPYLQDNDTLSIEPMHSEECKTEFCEVVKWQRTPLSEETTSSKKFHDFYSQQYHENYAINTTEVSDQNFLDEDEEETQIGNPFRPKKMKTTGNVFSSKIKKSPITVDLLENCTSLGNKNVVRHDQQAEKWMAMQTRIQLVLSRP